MESFWRSIAITLGKRWQIVLGAVVAITAVLAIGATNLEFATGQDSYLNPESQIAIDNVEFQDEFGGETVIMLFSANEDGADVADLAAEGGNLEELGRLHAELSAVDNVRSVITPAISLEFSDVLVGGLPDDANGIGPGGEALLAAPARDEAGAAARNADAQISLARRNAIDEADRRLGNPAWNDLLVYGNDGFTLTDGAVVPPADEERAIRLSLAGTFPDQQTAVGGVVLEGNLDLDSQSAATRDVLEILETAEVDGFELTITGSPVYLKEINDYLKGGMLTLGVAAIVVMAVVLALMFRVRWRLLPLLAVVFGIAWTFSIMGWIGVDLSLVTISGLPILIGVGIDFAIQIHNRVEEEVVLDHDEHPIGETLANLVPPLITATIAGVFAFAALRLSKVPMIRDFGVLLAVGIVMLVIVGIVVPASMLGIREWTSRTSTRGDSLVERIVVKLGSLPTKLGLGLVVLSLGLFLGGVLTESRTRIESDPINWIDQGSEVVQDVRRLENETGFATTLGVIVKANNVFDQDVIDLIHDFTIAAEERPEVVASSSLVNTMSKILTIEGATVIPPTEEELVAAAQVMPPDIAIALVNAPINEDPSAIPTSAQVNLRLAPASLEDRAVLVSELEADLQQRIDALDLPVDSILLVDLPSGRASIR